MRRYLFLLTLLTACSSAPVLPSPPTIALECHSKGATIRLSSPTPVFTPLLEVPRFPDGTVPVRYQLEDFSGVSEVLELSWCPVLVALEYSRSANGERLKVVR